MLTADYANCIITEYETAESLNVATNFLRDTTANAV